MLLVIDDINKRQQFDELVPDLKKLPGGSRVLITSRELEMRNYIWDHAVALKLLQKKQVRFRNDFVLLACMIRLESVCY